jgi:hypothetical protein
VDEYGDKAAGALIKHADELAKQVPPCCRLGRRDGGRRQAGLDPEGDRDEKPRPCAAVWRKAYHGDDNYRMVCT